MNISFEQGVQIDKFIKRFRAKDRVIGTVYIAISNNESAYGELKDVMDTEDAINEIFLKTKETIISDYQEEMYEMTAEELYGIIDPETICDLFEMYTEKNDS